jgi:hypothetical protein
MIPLSPFDMHRTLSNRDGNHHLCVNGLRRNLKPREASCCRVGPVRWGRVMPWKWFLAYRLEPWAMGWPGQKLVRRLVALLQLGQGGRVPANVSSGMGSTRSCGQWKQSSVP